MLDEQFWTDYTIRQPSTDQATHLRGLLKPWLADIHSVLEVGCNRGDNFAAFDCEVAGVEPNEYAYTLAREKAFVVRGDASEIKFPNDSFDLVYTMGVLIHLDPAQLDRALREIHRVSRRFILAVEYGFPVVRTLDYRGVRAGIWKRPYGSEYIRRFKDLVPVGSGLSEELDGCKWWMFEKE